MSVPGVNVICAATFLAAVGDIRRFCTSRQLVGYLGLDPKVRQSGSSPAKSGRISKRGSGTVRWALVEAAASVIRQPGPMHAYHQRLRTRRGHQIAVVGVARKLAVLFWCPLSRHEQYAHQQPTLTAKKMRLLEIRSGAPTLKGQRTGTFATREKMREAERALALQAPPRSASAHPTTTAAPTCTSSRTDRSRSSPWSGGPGRSPGSTIT
jgi:transposase